MSDPHNDTEIAKALQEEYDREHREIRSQSTSNRVDYRMAGYQEIPNQAVNNLNTSSRVVCSMCHVANQVPWSGGATESFRCYRCGFLNYYDATIYGRRSPQEMDMFPPVMFCSIS